MSNPIKLTHLVDFNKTDFKMPRIFCNVPLSIQDSYQLPHEAARHIQVLRLQPGLSITLFNGEGGEFDAQILEMTRKDVYVKILRFNPVERESPIALHLAIGMPANERMDWLIEKTTELGLSRLTPLMTQHNVVRVNPERGDKKLLHWNAISHSACAQSGRHRALRIDSPTRLIHWLENLQSPASNNYPRWYFSLGVGSEPFQTQIHHFKELGLTPNEVIVAFGPEGGWSLEEESLLQTHMFKPLSLGTRTLRAETAAISVVAALNLAL